MHRNTWIMMFALAALAACHKKDDTGATPAQTAPAKPAPAAPAAAKPAEPAAPPAPAPAAATAAAPAAAGHCPDGFTLNPKGGFCVKLPAGMQATGGGEGMP